MTEASSNTDNVVYVNFFRDDTVELNGTVYYKPKTRNEYLAICKQELDVETYEELMCGILDKEYYDRCDPEIQGIIHSYYSFPIKET